MRKLLVVLGLLTGALWAQGGGQISGGGVGVALAFQPRPSAGGSCTVGQVGVVSGTFYMCPTGGTWVAVGTAAAEGVSSFNTRTGAVTLSAADVNAVNGISNNTSGSAASLSQSLTATCILAGNTTGVVCNSGGSLISGAANHTTIELVGTSFGQLYADSALDLDAASAKDVNIRPGGSAQVANFDSTNGLTLAVLGSGLGTAVCETGGELGTCASFEYMKHDISLFSRWRAFRDVMQLPTYQYALNKGGARQVGTMEDAVAKIDPLLVDHDRDKDGVMRAVGVDYQHLAAVDAVAIQVEQEEIDGLILAILFLVGLLLWRHKKVAA